MKKLFGFKKQEFVMRFSKSLNQWEVVKDTRIVYMGSKEGCELYVQNMQVTAG